MIVSDLAVGQPFPVGVNYWPRRKAMYWWKDFERDEVAEEFDVIAGLGLRLVRVFLLWEDFGPTPDSVSPEALDDLEIVADVAAERGLVLDVTFFTGHMSGPNWAPAWLLGGDEPVLVLEPSSATMLRADLPQLLPDDPRAERLARRAGHPPPRHRRVASAREQHQHLRARVADRHHGNPG